MGKAALYRGSKAHRLDCSMKGTFALVGALGAAPALVAVAVVACGVQCRDLSGMFAASRYFLDGVCVRVAVMLALHTALTSLMPPHWATAGASALLTGLWAVSEVINITSFQYLNLPASSVSKHLPLQPSEAGGFTSMVATARHYVRVRVLVCLWLGSWLIVEFLAAAPAGAAWSACSAVAMAGFVSLSPFRRTTLVATSAEAAFLALGHDLEFARTARRPQPHGVRAIEGQLPRARHVLLIVNESAGDDVPASTGDGSLAERICGLSGDAGEWVRPINPVTPSSCTEIAIPCLMTGAAPEDGFESFTQLPSIFDMAKARGMTTLFYSAGCLTWANLENLLDFPVQDGILSPQLADLPYVNDLGCDDYLVAQRLHDHILATTDPLCIVVYFHGLHLPFQKDSVCDIPPVITDRRRRASHVTEASHALVFEALRRTGRYDDTLIISVGDHGEAFGVDPLDRSSRQSRLTRLSATVTRPMFVVKPPRMLDLVGLARLRANATQLVSLLDVAPTVASMLAVELKPDLRHAGYDLCGRVVPDERVHYTLTVTDWRSWPLSAVMIAQGQHRVCIDYQSREALCCDGKGQGLPAAAAAQTDALLRTALAVPLVQRAITRVFRDKLARGRLPNVSPPPRQAMAVVPGRLRAQGGRFEVFFRADTPQPEGLLQCNGCLRHRKGIQIDESHRGILIYGPYMDLSPGRYRATFVFAAGANKHPLSVDVLSDQQKDIQRVNLPGLARGRVASVVFDLEHEATGLEIRLHSEGGFAGRCLGLHLSALPSA